MTTLAETLGQLLFAESASITTAESCTGGLVSAALTDIAGSSAWFEQGFVTYSNQAKADLLNVDSAVFDVHGAVSEACVRAMAIGAAERSGARVAVAVSGVAGPDGGSVEKPVGTVWLAWVVDGCVEAERFNFDGDRRRVREQAVTCALRGTIARIKSTNRNSS